MINKAFPPPQLVSTGLDLTQCRLEQEQSKKLWEGGGRGIEIERKNERGTDEDGGGGNEEWKINIYVL